MVAFPRHAPLLRGSMLGAEDQRPLGVVGRSCPLKNPELVLYYGSACGKVDWDPYLYPGGCLRLLFETSTSDGKSEKEAKMRCLEQLQTASTGVGADM